jgi:hypothetical protein
MNQNEINILIMLVGIALFAVVVTGLDWLGRRQHRRHEKQ